MPETRRRFLGQAAVALSAVACAPGSAPESKGDTGTADPNLGWEGSTTAELDAPLASITSNADFYHVSVAGDQAVDRDTWTLTLQTVAGDSVALTAAELEAYGGEEFERTLTCIGSHSGVSTGNARWRGIRLADLLDAVGLTRDGDWVWVESVEGYATCLPASDLDAGMWVVWEMNGESLPADHGGPARILTPGRYGMKNPKWITRIAFLSAYQEGFWESFGWSDEAVNKTQCWVLTPDQGAEIAVGQVVTIQGCAFAGLRGISKVECSTDGFRWEEAEITYAGGPDVWTLWRIGWHAPSAGLFTIVVRATDGDGVVQVNLESHDDALDGLEEFHGVILNAT